MQVGKEDMAEVLNRAIERSSKVIEHRRQVIEAKPVEAEAPPDHSIHAAPISRSGFSKGRF
jgi:hypothetical protein